MNFVQLPLPCRILWWNFRRNKVNLFRFRHSTPFSCAILENRIQTINFYSELIEFPNIDYFRQSSWTSIEFVNFFTPTIRTLFVLLLQTIPQFSLLISHKTQQIYVKTNAVRFVFLPFVSEINLNLISKRAARIK